MLLEMACSRDGLPVVTADGSHLHSSYDPRRESERFLDARLRGAGPSAFILLGPCLDYMSPILRLRFPATRIVSVQYSPFFRGHEIAAADASWYPDSGLPVAAFLEAALGEEAASGIAVIDWPPAARAFPEAARAADAAVLEYLDRLSSQTATIKASGRSWILNSCRSFLLAGQLLSAREFDEAIVVALAGPSLEDSLSALAAMRGSFRLIAVSSALAACLAAGCAPDLVVATDGGFWSRLHLYPLACRRLPLAMPLSALPSSPLLDRAPLLLLDQGSFVEAELLPFLGGGFPLPPNGTVAGSALRLAASLGNGPVIAAGLDLAVRNESEHARPHGFDAVVGGGTARVAPLETMAFDRRCRDAPESLGGGWHGSRSQSVYAEALSREWRTMRGRVFRLDPSPRPIEGFVEISPSGIDAVLGAPRSSTVSPLDFGPRSIPSLESRRVHLSSRLARWRTAARLACAELAEGREPGDPRMEEFVRAFDHPFWAAARRAAARSEDPRPAADALAEQVARGIDDIEARLPL